jgi:hypothetical protein
MDWHFIQVRVILQSVSDTETWIIGMMSFFMEYGTAFFMGDALKETRNSDVK